MKSNVLRVSIMKIGTSTLALAITAFLSGCLQAASVKDTALTIVDDHNDAELLIRQTVEWPQNLVEVCTDKHYQGICQKQPEYIDVCWAFSGPFNNSISSIRFNPSATESAGPMSCKFYKNVNCNTDASHGHKPILSLRHSISELTGTPFDNTLQSVKCTRAPKQSDKLKRSEQATDLAHANMTANSANAVYPLCPKLCADKWYRNCDVYGDTCVEPNECRVINPFIGLSSVTFDNLYHWDGHMECDFYPNDNCHNPGWPWQWLHLDTELDHLGKKGFNDNLRSYKCYRVSYPPTPTPDPCCWGDCACPDINNGRWWDLPG